LPIGFYRANSLANSTAAKESNEKGGGNGEGECYGGNGKLL
jgi:hypothetical protein